MRTKICDELESARGKLYRGTSFRGNYDYDVANLRGRSVYGGLESIHAAAFVYGRPFVTWTPAGDHLRLYSCICPTGAWDGEAPPVHLLYSKGNHYDAMTVVSDLAPAEAMAGPRWGFVSESETSEDEDTEEEKGCADVGEPGAAAVEAEVPVVPPDSTTFPPILLVKTDGGPDHNCTHNSVILAAVAAFLKLNLDVAIFFRTAPNNSWANEVERCMSTLNLAIQGLAFARGELATHEALAAAASSIAQVRQIATKAGFKEEWIAAMAQPIAVLTSRMEQLRYTGRAVTVTTPATEPEVHDLFVHLLAIDPTLVITDTTAAKLRTKTAWLAFKEKHILATPYVLQIFKCEKPSCVCKPVRMPSADWVKCHPLPLPVIDPLRPDHYRSFEDTYGMKLDSLSVVPSRVKFVKGPVHNSFFNKTTAVALIQCGECLKPRVVFCADPTLLSAAFEAAIATATEAQYSCGDPLLPEESPDHGVIYVRTALNCLNRLERQYFSNPIFPDACIHCGSTDDLVETDNFKMEFKDVRPLCYSCRASGNDVKHGAQRYVGMTASISSMGKSSVPPAAGKGREAPRRPAGGGSNTGGGSRSVGKGKASANDISWELPQRPVGVGIIAGASSRHGGGGGAGPPLGNKKSGAGAGRKRKRASKQDEDSDSASSVVSSIDLEAAVDSCGSDSKLAKKRKRDEAASKAAGRLVQQSLHRALKRSKQAAELKSGSVGGSSSGAGSGAGGGSTASKDEGSEGDEEEHTWSSVVRSQRNDLLFQPKIRNPNCQICDVEVGVDVTAPLTKEGGAACSMCYFVFCQDCKPAIPEDAYSLLACCPDCSEELSDKLL